jgi:hypothetical protein
MRCKIAFLTAPNGKGATRVAPFPFGDFSGKEGGAKMVKIAVSAGFLTLLLAAVPDDGLAFRCGSGLVIEGDRTGKVLIECGPPTSKEVAGAKTTGKSQAAHGKKTPKSSEPGTHRENSGKVEKWFYNCGERDFVYILTFEGGVLTKEETQGYGKGRSDCQGRR